MKANLYKNLMNKTQAEYHNLYCMSTIKIYQRNISQPNSFLDYHWL